MIARAEAVLEHERGDTVFVEPVGDGFALMIDGQRSVAAAGADHDRRTCCLGRRREINRERGLVSVLGADGAGRALRPEQLDFRLNLGREERGAESKDGEVHGSKVLSWWELAGHRQHTRCSGRCNNVLGQTLATCQANYPSASSTDLLYEAGRASGRQPDVTAAPHVGLTARRSPGFVQQGG